METSAYTPGSKRTSYLFQNDKVRLIVPNLSKKAEMEIRKLAAAMETQVDNTVSVEVRQTPPTTNGYLGNLPVANVGDQQWPSTCDVAASSERGGRYPSVRPLGLIAGWNSRWGPLRSLGW